MLPWNKTRVEKLQKRKILQWTQAFTTKELEWRDYTLLDLFELWRLLGVGKENNENDYWRFDCYYLHVLTRCVFFGTSELHFLNQTAAFKLIPARKSSMQTSIRFRDTKVVSLNTGMRGRIWQKYGLVHTWWSVIFCFSRCQGGMEDSFQDKAYSLNFAYSRKTNRYLFRH